jgi:CDGSH-type Zn-finger protein/uncharacterized Fe-S cluster protein YjdI
MNESAISIRSREDLMYLLNEAAEVEHNLMCCYLFAAFSLKTEEDGIDAATAGEIAAWKRVLIGVAIQEMTHLVLANNLLMAIGGAPHLGRPNFPVAPGHHPADIVVALRRFDLETLTHFIFLERPEGVVRSDGVGFAASDKVHYRREAAGRCFMPSAQDYQTVGEFYRALRNGCIELAQTLGEATLFCGDPAQQVDAALVSLEGLRAVTDLSSALAAIDTIVEQGEGSPADAEHSHYRQFLGVDAAFRQRLAKDPAFDPARPVAANPVMRNPPQPQGRTYINHPEAAPLLDYANALYGMMLRCMAQGFADTDRDRKKRLIDAGIETMYALSPLAQALTRLPASSSVPGQTASLTFAVTRDTASLPGNAVAISVLAERIRLLAQGAEQVLPAWMVKQDVAHTLSKIADRLESVVATATDAIEVAQGREVTIAFNIQRCIHARFCVLGEPAVFKANVQGPWLAPDEATHAENLVAVARACPSGAITFTRHDGGPEESAPLVNLIQIRENGPLAVRADIALQDAQGVGFRATLCRCGASKNKPFCDGSHHQAGFTASGEPPSLDTTTLAARGGVLEIRPQINGPLAVSGNMEFISGTGRGFHKTQTAMLCRCGASGNKPFCDGSHARIGFKS